MTGRNTRRFRGFQFSPLSRGLVLGYLITTLTHSAIHDYWGLEGSIERMREGWLPTWGFANLAMYATYVLLTLPLVFGSNKDDSDG